MKKCKNIHCVANFVLYFVHAAKKTRSLHTVAVQQAAGALQCNETITNIAIKH